MIGLSWTGWDGSTWDLKNGPVWLTDGGIAGLGMPTFDSFVQTTAERDGQILTGWKAQPRDFLLPVRIGGTRFSPEEWIDIEDGWWKTMRPGKYGTISATKADGSVRTLNLRFIDDGGLAYAKDPSINKATVAALRMVADQPWWTGASFDKQFSHGGPGQNFFGGVDGGKGTPFVIGKSNTLDSATIDNDGDLPVYPTYVITGPISAFSIAVDGHLLAGRINVSATQTLTIETSPVRQLATLRDNITGVSTNVTRQLSSVNFRYIPEGVRLKLNITLTGNGSLTVQGNPIFYRGW